MTILPITERITYPFGQPPEGVDVLWRADAERYSYVVDAELELYGVTGPRLELTWWRVAKRTPCGARLDTGKFVYLDDRITRRRWASSSPEEAVASFVARRKRQIAILEGQLAYARRELALAETL